MKLLSDMTDEEISCVSERPVSGPLSVDSLKMLDALELEILGVVTGSVCPEVTALRKEFVEDKIV